MDSIGGRLFRQGQTQLGVSRVTFQPHSRRAALNKLCQRPGRIFPVSVPHKVQSAAEASVDEAAVVELPRRGGARQHPKSGHREAIAPHTSVLSNRIGSAAVAAEPAKHVCHRPPLSGGPLVTGGLPLVPPPPFTTETNAAVSRQASTQLVLFACRRRLPRLSTGTATSSPSWRCTLGQMSGKKNVDALWPEDPPQVAP